MPAHRRRRRRRRCTPLCVLLFVLFTFITLLFVFEMRIRPVFSEIALARAQSLAVNVINDEVERMFISESVEYGSLMIIQKDVDGKIAAITSNACTINRLKAEVAKNVQESLEKTNKMITYVPLGTFLSKGLFSGYGPRIPVRLTPMGRAVVEIWDSFMDAGINQTRHEIHLTVKAKINVLMVGGSVGADVEVALPLAQSVIVGNVPESFTNVTGVNGTPQDNVLNMLD